MLNSRTGKPLNKKLRLCVPALLLCWSLNAWADPLADFNQVGAAKLEVLFWDIYYSEFYTLSGSYQKDVFPQALKIHYLRDIQAKDLLHRTEQEWQKLGINKQTRAPWIRQLAAIWPDIKEGDELLLIVTATANSQFYFNQQPIGEIQSSEFGVNFLRIWLDEKSSYPELQKKLIGEQP